MELYLIRHPAVAAAEGLCYGQSDLPLRDPPDSAPFQALLPELQEVWSSPLQRCRALAERWQQPLQFDTRLLEVHFGTWEGQPWAALPPAEVNAWMADFVTARPPQGESLTDLSVRVCDWLAERRAAERGPLLVITHAGVIRCLVGAVLQLPLEQVFRLCVDPGSLSRIRLHATDPRFDQLVWLNRPMSAQTSALDRS